jgi:hypothetical protein
LGNAILSILAVQVNGEGRKHKDSPKEENMSYYDYYINREQYRERIRQAEMERIIRRIQKSNQEKRRSSKQEHSRESGSWIERISWAVKKARQVSAH